MALEGMMLISALTGVVVSAKIKMGILGGLKFGMDGYAETAIDKLKKGGKTAVIMGSEGKGMRRLVEEACDITVRLPISAKVESLNVSTAAAIALYEISKK